MVKDTTASERHSWGFRQRGWIGLLTLIPAGIMAMFAAPLTTGIWTSFGAEVLAWVFFLCGATLRLWSTLYVGGRKRTSLVVEGPYSLCRNPLYIGSFSLALSAGFYLQSPVFAAAVSVAAAGYAYSTIPAEEAFLREQFGSLYDEYANRVPRILPRPGAFRSSRVIWVDLSTLRKECAKAAGWIWIPLLGHLSIRLRAETWWPHWSSLL